MPFSRTYGRMKEENTDPWKYNKTYPSYKYNEKTYTDLIRIAIQRKYSLIRYFYTLLSDMSYGNNTFTIYKPMFFEFPED